MSMLEPMVLTDEDMFTGEDKPSTCTPLELERVLADVTYIRNQADRCGYDYRGVR